MSDTEEHYYKPPLIKYGSIISISHFQDDNAFIFANGHVKRDVTLKSFSLYKKAEELRISEKQRKKQVKNKKVSKKYVEDGLGEEGSDIYQEEDEMVEDPNQEEIERRQVRVQADPKIKRSEMESDGFTEGFNELNRVSDNLEGEEGMRRENGKYNKKSDGAQSQDNISMNIKKKESEKKKGINQNKQSFGSCLFMIFPKLSNAQKLKVIKNLDYESEDSGAEQDDAEQIFINKYEQIEGDQYQKLKTSVETNLILKRIKSIGQAKQKQMARNDTLREIISNPDQPEQKEEENAEGDILDRENLDKQKINLLNEYKANFDTFKKSRDSTVAYNSAIQLLHLGSAKWLSLKPIEAKHEKENFRMTLEATTSENTMFKVLPAFKHQKDGEQAIFANEIVYITRYQDINNRPTFLNISPEIKMMKQLTTTSFDYPRHSQGGEIFRKTNLSSTTMNSLNRQLEGNKKHIKQASSNIEPINKREVNGSQEFQTNFKLNLFQESYNDSNSYLKCGDVLWLHHSEAAGQIGVNRKDKGVNKYTFVSMDLKTWMSKDNLELKVIGTSKQSTYEHYSGNTFGMWQIESQKLSDGGYVEYNQLYRLKHLSTGFFLSVQRKNSQDKVKSNDLNDYFNLELIQVPDGSSLFQFDCLPSEKQKSQYVSLNSYAFIQNVKSKFYIDVEVDESEIQKFGNSFSQRSLPSLKISLNEKLLFKVYSADKNEVWEINYVISCFGYLVKLALALEEKQIETKNDEKDMFSLVRKIKKGIDCILDLTRFCENKVYNISQQQKFGTPNIFRQKLLREQYFIDLLVKILETALPKLELEVWIKSQDLLKAQLSQSNLKQKTQNQNDVSKQQLTMKSGNTSSEFFLRGGDSVIDQNEYAAYINWKVTLCKFIYKLLESICRGDISNQQYTFDLLPFFQIHSKYIPHAAQCIANICSSNEQLLMKLGDNLQVDYDFDDNNYVKEDMSKTVKFLINLYDGNLKQYQQKSKEKKIDFAQHEKLTCKPINLINFFVNLLWDEKAMNKADYMNFLSSICTYKSKGITINQENIFKLFKKFTSFKKPLNLEIKFVDGTLQKPQNQRDLSTACSHILFFANLSYGRNFLWRKELMSLFKSEDLFKFIWDQSLINDESQHQLSSALCKLAQTLYINHEPLNPVYKPNYCRLFCDVPQKKKKNLFSLGKDTTQVIWDQEAVELQKVLSPEDIESYSNLLNQLKSFLIKLENEIEEQIEAFAPQKLSDNQGIANQSPHNNQQSSKPKNVSGSEILETIIDLLNLILKLDVYTITMKEADYSDLLNILIRILQYDRIGIKFMSALYMSEKSHLEKKQQSQKKVDITNITSGVCSGLTSFFNLITNMLQPKKTDGGEEEGQDGMFEFRTLDDNMLFNNPIMKGFVKLNNLMETIMQADNESIQLENKIKMKICEILDRLLCLRQDYLLSNSLYYFKKKILSEKANKIKLKYEISKKNASLGKKQSSAFLGGDLNDGDEGDTLQLLDVKNQPVIAGRQSKSEGTNLNLKRRQSSKKSAIKQTPTKGTIKDQKDEPKSGNKLTSFFGLSKTTKTVIDNVPIEQQFIDWWLDKLKHQKKKSILPLIALTGLPEVDKLYKESEEIKVFGLTDEITHPKFFDYLDDPKKFMPDFDLLLSACLKKEKADSKSPAIVSALPPLLCTFLLVQDQELEVQVLNIIMRLFNQRFEMIENLTELQIIFDQKNMELFKFLRAKYLVLQSYIQRSEIWFQTVEKVTNPNKSTFPSQVPQILLPPEEVDEEEEDEPENKVLPQGIDRFRSISASKRATFIEKEHDAYKIYKLIESVRNGLFADITLNPNQDEFGQSVTRNSTVIDVEKQKIHKYLKLHEPIITLIQDGMTHFDKIIMSENYTLTTKRMLYHLFKEAFGYLKNFVEKNNENQMLISEYMFVFTSHLQYDLGQIDLICEIFRDNLDLISKLDPELVRLFLNLIEHEGRQEKFLDFFIVIQKSKHKMIFENQLLVLNSFLPMDGLTELEVKLTYTDGAKKQSELQFYFEDVSEMSDKGMIERLLEVEFRDTYLDEPFKYHAKILMCLLYSILQANVDVTDFDLSISKDHFNISVAKLKKTFSFYYLLEVLQKEDDFVSLQQYDYEAEEKQQGGYPQEKNLRKQGFSFLKPYVADFIKIVHIFSDSLSTESLFSELSFTQKEFSSFVEKEAMRFGSVSEENLEIKYIFYICVHVLGMVAAYFDKYLRRFVDKSSPDEEERRDLTKVREFAEIVVKKMKVTKKIRRGLVNYSHHYGKAKELQRLCQTQNQIEEQLENQDFFDGLSRSSNSQSEIDDEVEDPPNIFEKSKDKGNQSSSKQPSSILKMDQKTAGTQKKEFKMESPSAASKDKKLGEKADTNLQSDYQQLHWKQFVQAMNISPFINEQVELEVRAFADAILNIESYIDPELQRFMSPKLDLDLILKKFIRFLQFSFKDGGSKRTTLTLLKVLKTIVEKDPEDISNRQDQMDILGAGQMVLIILSERSNQLDGELYINFIQFLNTLLKGGNSRVQKTVFDFFINQPKSEIIFQKFSFFIKKQIDFIEQDSKVKKRREEEKKGKFNNINKDDAEDGISQIMDKDEEAKEDTADDSNSFTHSQDVEILDNILDFLSLAVSGHYTEMQDYIREQHNLRSNNDMVSNIADLLKAYYHDGGQKQYYESMMKCLDTLIKFVLGPCPQNQHAVSDSKFFDVCHDILERQMKQKQGVDDSKSQFTSNKKSSVGGQQTMSRSAFRTQSHASKSKGSQGEEPLENWMVARIQYKCLCLVHGLLEGRSVKTDSSLLKKISRNIQVETIEKRIVEIYTNFDSIYQGEYTMKSLEHLTLDPSSTDEIDNPQFKKNPDKYMHTIIQNAFLLYILFCLYMVSGERIDSQIMTFYKNQHKKSIEDEKSAIMQFLTGNNIIGNLVTFFMSFIESSIKTAQSMKQEAEKQMKKMAGGSSGEQEEDDAARRIRQAKQQEKFKENLKKTVQFLFKNTAHIEVLRNGELETIFFTLLPYCKRLPKEKKQEFNEGVDRSNEKEKVTGLMNAADYILDVCKQEEDLNKFFMANKFLSLFANYVELWKDVAFILTILLNLFNLFTYTSAFGDRFNEQHFLLDAEKYTVSQTKSMVFILGIIMTCCSLFVVCFFLAKNLPLLIKRIWLQEQSKLFSEKPPLLIRMVLWIFKLIKILVGLLQEIEIIYYICYGGFAILGTFVQSLFFTFHLTEIFIRFPTLKSVVQAVTIPKKNLFLTYILYLIFVYLFTLITFQFVTTDITEECSTLAYCFAFLIDYTFKANGGIGGYITGNGYGSKDGEGDLEGTTIYYDQDWFKPGRYFFDNLFCILIVIILVQIVAGQIIDQFGELREAENDRKEDTEGKCFICGIKSDVFDKKIDKSNRGGFHSHIKENHYMWNYVFYIGYLRSKNVLEFSGIEQYIHDLIKENDSGWFPTNRSSDLDVEEDDSKREKILIDSIISSTDSIGSNTRNILKQLKDMRKK